MRFKNIPTIQRSLGVCLTIQGLDTSLSSLLSGHSTEMGDVKNANYIENKVITMFPEDGEFDSVYERDFYDKYRQKSAFSAESTTAEKANEPNSADNVAE